MPIQDPTQLPDNPVPSSTPAANSDFESLTRLVRRLEKLTTIVSTENTLQKTVIKPAPKPGYTLMYQGRL